MEFKKGLIEIVFHRDEYIIRDFEENFNPIESRSIPVLSPFSHIAYKWSDFNFPATS